MKLLLIKGLSALAIATAFVPVVVPVASVLAESGAATAIARAGTLRQGNDHFLEVEVKGEALERLKVVCVTFHKLDEVKVVSANNGQAIPYSIQYGFEEFTVTFDQPIAVGDTVRIVMEGSSVRGLTTGITVPYRVFATSSTFGEIPIGTAIVRAPDASD